MAFLAPAFPEKHKKNVTFSISSLSQRSVEGESSVHLDIHLTYGSYRQLT